MQDNHSSIIKPQYSRAELAFESEVLDFVKSLTRTFSDAEKLLSSDSIKINDRVLKNRIKLATFVRKFHSEADTLHDNITKQWILL
ncbi:MAG TPA: hypothetical protein VHF65_09820, partial [Nitrososphaera sp.]|nr:hypothetical protein [Nitrososphaera sp.]